MYRELDKVKTDLDRKTPLDEFNQRMEQKTDKNAMNTVLNSKPSR